MPVSGPAPAIPAQAGTQPVALSDRTLALWLAALSHRRRADALAARANTDPQGA